MKLKFNNNGHEYNVRDFLSYEMNQLYLTQKEYIRERIRQHTDDQQGVYDVYVNPPNNITAIKFSSGDFGKGKLELFIDNIENYFSYGSARFDAKVDLRITADLEIVSEGNSFKLKVTNTIAQSTTPQKTGCSPYLYCDYLWSLIVWNWALTGFPNYTEEINDTTYTLLNLSRIPAV